MCQCPCMLERENHTNQRVGLVLGGAYHPGIFLRTFHARARGSGARAQAARVGRTPRHFTGTSPAHVSMFLSKKIACYHYTFLISDCTRPARSCAAARRPSDDGPGDRRPRGHLLDGRAIRYRYRWAACSSVLSYARPSLTSSLTLRRKESGGSPRAGRRPRQANRTLAKLS